mmetsp:Transcript_100847/g.323641  ORF Transcript_100847/g.323641 Transcript_100847/m.323641 type:complete len:279 (-) Transcript_100847:265-1101(-)
MVCAHGLHIAARRLQDVEGESHLQDLQEHQGAQLRQGGVAHQGHSQGFQAAVRGQLECNRRRAALLGEAARPGAVHAVAGAETVPDGLSSAAAPPVCCLLEGACVRGDAAPGAAPLAELEGIALQCSRTGCLEDLRPSRCGALALGCRRARRPCSGTCRAPHRRPLAPQPGLRWGPQRRERARRGARLPRRERKRRCRASGRQRRRAWLFPRRTRSGLQQVPRSGTCRGERRSRPAFRQQPFAWSAAAEHQRHCGDYACGAAATRHQLECALLRRIVV